MDNLLNRNIVIAVKTNAKGTFPRMSYYFNRGSKCHGVNVRWLVFQIQTTTGDFTSQCPERKKLKSSHLHSLGRMRYTSWQTATLLKVGIKTQMVLGELLTNSNLFFTPTKFIPHQKMAKKNRLMYNCMRKRTQVSDRSEKYFQERSQVMGEAGPVMQWWWIYTTSFPSEPITLALSAVHITAQILCS